MDSPYRVLEKWSESKFYKGIPQATNTGDPFIYRQWSVEGVSTKLSTADTVDIVSSNNNDSGDTDLVVIVSGRSSGSMVSEEIILNGTTTVNGTITFDAGEVYISKSKDTQGTITATENSGSTTLVTLGKQERNPRFKVISLYFIPGSAKTIRIHYYTHPKILKIDGESPPFDEKWHYVVRLGTLAKVYQSLNKEESSKTAQHMYAASVRSMVLADQDEPDMIIQLKRHNPFLRIPRIRRDQQDVTA